MFGPVQDGERRFAAFGDSELSCSNQSRAVVLLR